MPQRFLDHLTEGRALVRGALLGHPEKLVTQLESGPHA